MQGVIFDLDGVMLDSEAFSIQVWQDILGRFGAHLDRKDYEAMIGMAVLPSAELVIRKTGVPLGAEEIMEMHWDEIMQIIIAKGTPEPGLMRLLETFSGLSLPMAVASNSPSSYVETVLNALGVRQQFQTVICADQIRHGKPDPEIYLKAAEAIGIAPENCLAIEDSPIGLQAALAAGMRCAVIPNPHLKSPVYTGAFGEYASLCSLLENLPDILN
jgi:HAD superfamily hydrolase (TIGR01509 family)